MSNCPLNKTMNIFNNDTNIINIFTFNQFSEDVEFIKNPIWDNTILSGKAVDDQDITQIRFYLSAVHNFEPNKNIVGEACYLISKRNSYHPVKNYIEKEKWDKIPRLNEWLIKVVGCDDNIYTRAVSSKFLIAAVNRIYNPGCKFDHMLILEGDQGVGKSTMIEELAGKFYLDTNFENKDKDLIDSMRTAFIIEISELTGMNKKDIDWLKSFLSKKVDCVRLPYASRTKDFKRKNVFFGTYNPSGNNMYLRDDTGNRRFWPIECKSKKFIDLGYLKENKHQLWAEALMRFKLEEKYYIDDSKALEILKNVHEERELESPTHKKISKWLKTKNYEVSMEEIMSDCLKINTDNKLPKELLSISTTVGIIMKKLEWKKGNNENRDKYYPPEQEWTE